MSDEYYSTGRGGAGNVHQGKPPNVQENRMGATTPHLTSEYYTTGRGGAGNIKKNDREGVEARIAQDVDDPLNGISPSMSNRSVGRGGYGNLQHEMSNTSTHEHQLSNNNNNEPGLLKRALNFFKPANSSGSSSSS